MLSCTFFGLTALTLFTESRGLSKSKSYTSAAGVALLTSFPFYFYKPFVHHYLYIEFVLGIGLFALNLIVPFLQRSADSNQIWLFNYQSLTHVSYMFLTTCILYAALAFVLTTLLYLFSFPFDLIYYWKLFILTFFLFFPLMALSGIPRKFEALPNKEDGKILFTLIEWIIVPILYIYTFILYSYIFKLMVTGTSPKSGTFCLVAIFALLGVFTYLATTNTVTNLGKPTQLFRKYFWKAIIAPLGLMGVSIYIRVAQYSLTEIRYLMGVCLIWLFTCSILSLTKLRRSTFIKTIYVSLVGLMALSSFGPWSVSTLPALSQARLLENTLKKYDILVNNTLHSPKEEISSYDRNLLSGTLDFLVTRHQLHLIQGWFKEPPEMVKSWRPQEVAAKLHIPYTPHPIHEYDHPAEGKLEKKK
jgi:hypothetical protein